MKNRIEWVDVAKGLGIFFVVLGHLVWAEGLAATVLWAFHMPLFFFLSGLTAKAWRPGAAPDVVRGIKSLAVPYVFFTLVSIPLWMVAKDVPSSVATWSVKLLEALYGVGGPERKLEYNVALWFFPCLISVRLIFYSITSVIQGKLVQLAIVIILAFLAHIFIIPHLNSVLWNFDVALIALVFFQAGYMFQEATLSSATLASPKWLVACLIAVTMFIAAIIFNGRVDMNLRVFGNPAWFYMGAFSGIFSVAVISSRLESFKFLKLVGHASIVIFPVHMLFGLLPNRFWSIVYWLPYKLTDSSLLRFVMVAILEVLICLLIYLLIIRWAPFLIGQTHKKTSINAGSLKMAK